MKSSAENWNGKQRRRDRALKSARKEPDISKLANACSLLCSLLGASLIVFILFGPRSILSYRNVELASNCAIGLLVAAFLLGISGAALAFKKAGKLNCAELCEETDTFKINAVETGKPLPKAEKVTANSNEQKNQRISSAALVDGLRTRSKIDPDRLMKETNSSAGTLESEDTTLHSKKDEFSAARNQLVPVKNQYDIPPFQRRGVSSAVPNRWNFTSSDEAGSNSITEVVATKRVRFLSGDYDSRQEEYEVKQTTTFFKVPHLGSPSCRISEIDCDQRNRHVSPTKYSSLGTTKFQPLSDVISKFESLQFHRNN